MSKESLNELAWIKLFEKYNILQNIDNKGYFFISSAQINEYRQARLMTKFDHESNLPKIFSENSLAILPVTRGDYIISRFKAYHEFEEIKNDVKNVNPPSFIQSLNYNNVTSETTALNIAYSSGILKDFLDEEKLLPTVGGRMSSENFKFKIANDDSNLKEIEVINSQLEIDGAYEGFESLTIIEAKNVISDNFLVRQLYYPFRKWSNKLHKKIRTVFLVYSNGIFYLYEYEFADPENYSSIYLKKQKSYAIEDMKINFEEINEVLNSTSVVPEPEIPFPQADKFERIINLIELLYENNTLSHSSLTENYDFTTRQTDYYTNAAMYLGLIKKEKLSRKEEVKYVLTDKGEKIFNLAVKQRTLFYIKCIFEKIIFRETYKEYSRLGKLPDLSYIVGIMRRENLYKINSEKTYYRRAQTVLSWISWIDKIGRTNFDK